MSEIRANKIGNASGVEAIDVTGVTGSNGITIEGNGLISSGPQSGGVTDFSSQIKVGTLADGTYSSFSNQLDSTNANNIKAFYMLINPRLIWLSFYIWRSAHISSWSAAYGWAVEIGIPNVKFLGGGNGAYQFIKVGYHVLNGTSFFNNSPHRWQANTSQISGTWQNNNLLMLYGTQWNTTWSSGSAEFAGSGMLMLADPITS